MRSIKKWLISTMCIFMCMTGISGCGEKENKKLKTESSVEKVVREKTENKKEEKQKGAVVESKNKNDVQQNGDSQEEEPETDPDVDYDLTSMNSDMIYATVYQLMVEPDKYIGKTIKINGIYYAGQDAGTGKYYHYCVIQDATACCSQGLEFVWGDGSHVYPDEYPADETEIEVKGTFESYKENGDDRMYYHLANAEMKIKK